MIKVAFAGNPNVGKSALINAISGAKLHVGNWPGVTIEKKEAEVIYKNEEFLFVDLPGVYSLSPYSMEEIITRDYIINENPDIVINVVDSTNLERNLYLTTLLKELGKPMILLLNFHDEFEKLNYKLDLDTFEDLIGIKSFFTSAKTKKGIDALLDYCIDLAKTKKEQHHIKYKIKFNNFIEKKLIEVEDILKTSKDFNIFSKQFHLDYMTIKILEKDKHFLEKIENFDINYQKIELIRKELEKEFEEDIETIFTESRYGVIKGILAKTFTTSIKNRLDTTEKIDKIILNQFFGPISFVIIMGLLFSMTFNGSAPLIDYTDQFIADYIGKYIALFLQDTPNWLQSFIVDGIIGGLGGILVFVPLMLFLHFFITLLEESGYMSRIAFIMDRLMKNVGLNGKAFLPMMLGFGCSVPAIYSTRTLEDKNSSKLTALMIPFMSCGARLPVYALFTAAFFGKQAGFIILSIYLIGILTAIIIGSIYKAHKYFKPEEKALLIELPPYRIPSFHAVISSTFRKTGEYIKKAGTIILAMLVILWALMYFPNNGNVESSFVGKFGKTIAPVFKPTGFADRWETVAAIPPGLIAKEIVVGFLGQALQTNTGDEEKEIEYNFINDTKEQIFMLKDAIVDSAKSTIIIDIKGLFTPPSKEELEEQGGNGIITQIQNLWTDSRAKLRAFSYMLFILLTIPCVVTLGAYKQEFGWGILKYVFLIYLIVPYLVSTLVFQIGSLIIR
ncbi:ferrous iron transport protein B [Hypnocyclicus thermotrophus]|uniref:Ferrous iron transport protein B n=1 Tax=Hypnocyclicus thermotrophus TaxID=1627895 RepID=A0AA46I6B0_9FUSO|nr:ferrous iron transport protein B [Hypnocyclicus thermotrophus]TDT72369.1 ferrous iron transport protein B [Hypnocyclicus thermotrophus]